MCNILCKQKGEGKSENLTNATASFDHSAGTPHPLCGSALLLTAGDRFLQRMGIRDEQTRPSLRDLCA